MAETAARIPRGEWIGGRGWDQNLWQGMRFPTRASLDRAAPDHPVSLTRVDGHAIWANAAALHAAGVTRDTRDPSGGVVVRDERGEPTGLLVDTAQRLIQVVQRGQAGSWVPSGTAGRAQRAGVSARCSAGATACMSPKGVSLGSMRSATSSGLRSRARAPSTRPRPSIQPPVRASESRTR